VQSCDVIGGQSVYGCGVEEGFVGDVMHGCHVGNALD
jgi:hypothetical protein